ncbi:MAG TPA: tRNA (adenosine(37)-N6)-threonylcarbamoyltransferase complex ATPase subunit type 1 TsaE [Nitrospinae bacterium]|nr:tRNA (adenosine(37)-N6)-threonylcarbamoyltransferase complex ATPase subunit type 1 TsaE [Nitrospinota bacterium]
MELISSSQEDTKKIGRAIGKLLTAGDVVCLYGDLGSGKTCLAQGIIKGLDVAEDKYLRSPTFTLINQYKGRMPACHLDLYRLDNINEIEDIGIEEHIHGDEVVIIEWAERMERLLPEKRIDIHISSININTRKIVILCPDNRFEPLSLKNLGI